MKKTFFMLVLLILSGTLAMGQIKLGIRGGVSSSSIKVDQVITDGVDDIAEIVGTDAAIGFHAGVMMRIQLFSAFIQPELLFSSTGGEVKVIDLQNNGFETIKNQSFKKIDIPVMVGMKFGPVRLGAGPVASYMIQSSSLLDDLQTDVEEEFNKATFGYQAGLGLDIWKLALDFKYEGNLSKLGDGVSIGNYNANFDTRNPQLIVSLGLFF